MTTELDVFKPERWIDDALLSDASSFLAIIDPRFNHGAWATRV